MDTTKQKMGNIAFYISHFNQRGLQQKLSPNCLQQLQKRTFPMLLLTKKQTIDETI